MNPFYFVGVLWLFLGIMTQNWTLAILSIVFFLIARD